MSTQLFGPPNTGGSFADKFNQAKTFLDNARGKAPGADVVVEPTQGLAAEAPAVAPAAAAPGAAAPTGVDAAAPVTSAAGHDPDGLAAAARAAAQQSMADPAYVAATQQPVEFIVQPRVMMQGQAGPVIVPVDIPIAATPSNVRFAPAQVVTIDAAGRMVAAPQAAAAATATAPPAAAGQVAETAGQTRGFRSWGVKELASLGRNQSAAAPASAPQTPQAAPAQAPAAASRSWREQLNDAVNVARGPAAQAPAAPVVVADAPTAVGAGLRSRIEDALGLPKAGGAAPAAAPTVASAPKRSLLETIRSNTAGIGEMLTRGAPAGSAAPVVDEAATAARPGVRAAIDAAIQAAKIAK